MRQTLEEVTTKAMQAMNSNRQRTDIDEVGSREAKTYRSGNKMHMLEAEFNVVKPLMATHRRSATIEEVLSEDLKSEETYTQRRPIKGWYEMRQVMNPNKVQLESSFKKPKYNHSIDATPEDRQHVYDKFKLMQHMEVIKGQ